MHSFHFLRPLWFLALIPLTVLLLWVWRQRRAGRSWQSVVDARLLPYLLMDRGGRRSSWVMAALVLGTVLAVTALAGPTWNKLQQPVFRRQSALVVLLDLSRSMDAGDLQPSRLQMAKFKLRDILARRKEGDTALVVFAADPFVVTPLTNDVDTIDRQLSSLTTDLMPVQGSRADRAIAKAQALLQQSGAVHGDVLLITDGIDNDDADKLHDAVRKLVAGGYRLSVLGVGTAAGAPIPLAGGGFFKDSAGAIVLPKLDEPPLTRLAAEGHGIYRHLAADDADTDALTRLFAGGWPSQQAQKVAGMKSDQWREAGPWLLLPLLALASLVFRRGYLLMVCMMALLLPMPRNAYALGWHELWQRSDQRGAQALAAQQPKRAAELFKDPKWRAAAHYRAGDYQAALKDLAKQRGAAAAYNRGNALAHLGKYQQALNAYEDALKQDPNFKDAAYNRDLVKKWLQPPQHKKDSSGNNKRKNQSGKKQAGKQQGQPQSGEKGKQAQAKQSQGKGANQGKDQTAAQADKHNDDKKGDSATVRHQQEKPSSAQQKTADAKNTTSKDQKNNQGKKDQRTAMNDVAPQSSATAEKPQSESQQATAQWLRRIPDDPGGLWRRKFLYQYKREHQSQQSEAKPW